MIEKFEQLKLDALYFIGQGRTALAAVAGFAAMALSMGLLSGTAQTVAQWIVGLATVLGVYVVKDDPTPVQTGELLSAGAELERRSAQ